MTLPETSRANRAGIAKRGSGGEAPAYDRFGRAIAGRCVCCATWCDRRHQASNSKEPFADVRPPSDPFGVEVRSGERVRLRLVNAAADTLFSFSVDGHPLTLVSTDGQAVTPAVEGEHGVLDQLVGRGGAARQESRSEPAEQVVAGDVVRGHHEHAPAAAGADPVARDRE